MTGSTAGRSRWASRCGALMAVALFVWGALLLADWLRDRAGDTPAAPEAAASGASGAAVDRFDPRMEAYLDAAVNFGPVRALTFGADRALYAAGPSQTPPEAVFDAVAEQLRAGWTREAARRAGFAGPSARAVLRFQQARGRFAGGAFLMRLAPDLDAAQRGRLRLEPGGLLLALDAGPQWEYVAFYFPSGLDLDALLRAHRPPEGALEPLGTPVRRYLQPALWLAPGAEGSVRTVFCRARGRADHAVDSTVRALEGAGWESLPPTGEGGENYVRVLRGPRGEVWLSAPAPGVDDGLVTVLISTRTS